jgi:hypothetical protein
VVTLCDSCEVRTESRFHFVVVTLCDSCEVRTESRYHFVPSHHLLNVLLQIANKLGLKKKVFISLTSFKLCSRYETIHSSQDVITVARICPSLLTLWSHLIRMLHTTRAPSSKGGIGSGEGGSVVRRHSHCDAA